MQGVRLGRISMGRIGYAITCLAAAVTLAGAGYAHEALA